MVNPVQASDGWSYERDAISKWCENHDTSPLDPSVEIDISQLKPNRSLRDIIQRLVESNEFEPNVCQEWLEEFAKLDSAPQLFREGRINEAAELGHSQAMGILANRYYNGIGVLVNLEMSLKWAHRAAIAGDGNGQFRMGYAFQVGEGRPKNYAESLKYYTVAYYNGIDAAAHNISEMYSTGGFGITKNVNKVVEWCGRSNTSTSLHLLATCYYNGDGVSRNFPEARRNFKAAGNFPDSQYMLGVMLLRGEGGPVNLVEGVKCIDRAAKRGHEKALVLKQSIINVL
jgi:TPR repeat protein